MLDVNCLMYPHLFKTQEKKVKPMCQKMNDTKKVLSWGSKHENYLAPNQEQLICSVVCFLWQALKKRKIAKCQVEHKCF